MEDDYLYIRQRFPFLEDALVKEISDCAVRRNLSEGERLLSEGEFVRWLPVVTEGLLSISRSEPGGNDLFLYYLYPGEVCGMAISCCMSQHRSNIKAVAESDSVVLMIPGQNIELWLTEYRSWKEFIMNSFRHRFDEMLSTIDALAFMKMDDRLVRYLKEHKRATGDDFFKGSHSNIANHLNTSREVISRLLKGLEKEGRVSLSRNEIDLTRL